MRNPNFDLFLPKVSADSLPFHELLGNLSQEKMMETLIVSILNAFLIY